MPAPESRRPATRINRAYLVGIAALVLAALARALLFGPESVSNTPPPPPARSLYTDSATLLLNHKNAAVTAGLFRDVFLDSEAPYKRTGEVRLRLWVGAAVTRNDLLAFAARHEHRCYYKCVGETEEDALLAKVRTDLAADARATFGPVAVREQTIVRLPAGKPAPLSRTRKKRLNLFLAAVTERHKALARPAERRRLTAIWLRRYLARADEGDSKLPEAAALADALRVTVLPCTPRKNFPASYAEEAHIEIFDELYVYRKPRGADREWQLVFVLECEAGAAGAQ